MLTNTERIRKENCDMKYQKLRKELRKYYSTYADEKAKIFCEECLAELDAKYDESMTVFQMKRMQYNTITEKMSPVLFHTSPFYYETGTLASICDGARDFRGHKNAAGWVYWKNEHWFKDQDPELYALKKRQTKEKMYQVCGPYNDTTQHFCFNHRPVLEIGLKGIYQQAMDQMDGATEDEKDFLLSVCDGMLCIKRISEKFAEKAKEMLANATDPEEKKNMERIADAAARTPWEAPKSFYEALNMYAFMRKALGSLEGIGFSSFGRLDMDLYPFYKKDIDAGKLTYEEAYELISMFLLTFDCHYNQDMKFEGYSDHELENTYVLGGCDLEGNPLCNDITIMCLRATREQKLIYPKIKLRYSANSPKEMLDEANIDLVNGRSVVLYQNDDATIPAVYNTGRTIEEARDYLIFGCWGINGNGYEKVDDGGYINVIKPMELAVHKDFEKMKEIGMEFKILDGAQSFDEVYQIMCDNLRVLLEERARVTRLGGNIWYKVDVLPLFSSTLASCIEKRKDFTQGGAKYRDERNEVFAFVNLVNSLLVIKELCFESKKYTLTQLLDAVRNNWKDNEQMRIDATKCHAWGDGSDASKELGNKLNNDISKMLGSLEGMYGGKIYIGHLAYTEVRWWGEVTRATPDGRYNGDYLAQGLTPSRLTKIPYVTTVINSMTALDASIMAGNSVINIILPAGKVTLDICESFLRTMAGSAIQSLQLNCASREQCLDAQKHPEKYPDLIVRVTGFSAKFTSLSPEWQKEFITRNFYE